MDLSKFLVSLVINIALGILYFIVFLIFKKRVKSVYEPRSLNLDDNGAPRTPDRGMLGWAFSALNYNDERLFRTHGLDALIFVRFTRLMLVITSFQFVLGAGLLIPINATGENTLLQVGDRYRTDGLAIFTMASIEHNSLRLWAPAFSVIFNSLVVYYYTYTTYKLYMTYRVRHKSSERNENYAVMIDQVPTGSGPEELLSVEFERSFPNQIQNVVRARRTMTLDKKFGQRGKDLRNMERALWTLEKTGVRPTAKDKPIIGKKVDAIDFYSMKYNENQVSINYEQSKEHSMDPVVFITFKSISTAANCVLQNFGGTLKYITHAAPEPRDICWPNLGINIFSHWIRTAVVSVAMFFLIIFWMALLTFAASLANLSQLSQVHALNFLSNVQKLGPTITGFIEGYLPALVIVIAYALLTPFLILASKMQGFHLHSQIDNAVMHKYHLFLVYNVFIIYSIAGSAFQVLADMIKDPSIIPKLLSSSLPQQSTTFICYILLLSFQVQTSALCRPVALILYSIKKKYMCKSPRDFREVERPGKFVYSVPAATHLLVFTIVLFYSTLAPLILAFGVIYFALAHVITKYNIVYVFEPDFEGGGYLWPSIFHRLMMATLLYQLFLIGEFTLYNFIGGIAISSVMAVVTVVFWVYSHFAFKKAFTHSADASLLRIGEITTESLLNGDDSEDHLDWRVYLQPTLQPPLPEPELPGQPAPDSDQDKHDPKMNYGASSGVSSMSAAASLKQ